MVKSPKQRKKKMVTLEMPIKLVDRIDSLRGRKATRSAFIRQCLEAQLDKADVLLTTDTAHQAEAAFESVLTLIESQIKDLKEQCTLDWVCYGCGTKTEVRVGQCPVCREEEQVPRPRKDDPLFPKEALRLLEGLKRKKVV